MIRSIYWPFSLTTVKTRFWNKIRRSVAKVFRIVFYSKIKVKLNTFHLRGDLWNRNFGLQQKYPVCEYSICEVLLYQNELSQNLNTFPHSFWSSFFTSCKKTFLQFFQKKCIEYDTKISFGIRSVCISDEFRCIINVLLLQKQLSRRNTSHSIRKWNFTSFTHCSYWK